MIYKHLFTLACFYLFTVTQLASAQEGTLDNTFGTNGTFIAIGTSNRPSEVVNMHRQQDGKFIVPGTVMNTTNTEYYPMTVRIKSNGTADSTWGLFGYKYVTNTPREEIHFTKMAACANGKLLLAGHDQNLLSWSLIRLNADNSRDTTFRFVAVGASDFRYHFVHDLVIAPDSSIFVVGHAMSYFNPADTNQFVVAKYKPDGRIDSSFNGSGMVKTAKGWQAMQAYALEILPGGKLLIAGGANVTGTNPYGILVRLLPNGAFDNTFGTAGVVHHALPHGQRFEKMTRAANGGILLMSNDAGLVGGLQAYVWRYKADASGIDSSFGLNGVGAVAARPAPFDTYISDMVLQRDGKIVLAGQTQVVTYVPANDSSIPCIIRLTSSGLPDVSFGTNGAAQIYPAAPGNGAGLGAQRTFNTLLVQPDDYIVAGGYSGKSMLMARFKATSANTPPPAGIVPIGRLMDVRAYPNPTDHTLQLDYTLTKASRMAIFLTDMAGRQYALQPAGFAAAGPHHCELNLPAGLPSGNYLLSLQDEGGITGINIQIVR